MIRVTERHQNVPEYVATSLTALPLLYRGDHLYPYASYSDTAKVPVPRSMLFIDLENDFLRVTIAPELGGRVHGIFDKRIGKEVLFANPVVRPTRILPIWAYVSGGIEFNFPIAHSPTSAERVGYSTRREGDYAFVRVGEREARTGMEWTVELGLLESEPILIQRTALRNRTTSDHPWMMWSNCAVRSTPETEFIYPDGSVLVHDTEARTVPWPAAGLNWEKNIRRMVGVFWTKGQGNHFGVFHHDLGFGLVHVADPNLVPGKKLWSYGCGRHRHWGELTSDTGESYAEIQSGPLFDQGQKPMFPQGKEMLLEEFWIPVHARAAFDRVELPRLKLPPFQPEYLGYDHAPQQVAWEKFRAGEGSLPSTPVLPGLELETPLRRELASGNREARLPLAVWLAFHKRPEEARAVLDQRLSALESWVAGLIERHGLKCPQRAVALLEASPMDDPIAIAELDKLYEQLDMTTERQALLATAQPHRLVTERKTNLALKMGNPAEALRLLTTTEWPLEHQRYVRTELWRRAREALGEPLSPVPESLGEDDLAVFGAYWSE